MSIDSNPNGIYIHFDPNKVVLPPIFGGPLPQSSAPPTSPTDEKKRKRDSNTATSSFNNFEKVLRRATDNEQNYLAKSGKDSPVTKDRLKSFESRELLIKALRDSFRESQNVNFAASYRSHDPDVSHKHRIQGITHEIWKATGYRFTVKDHPRIKDGHKTRLWCSQDEAHKNRPSKSSQSPRVSSDGAILAKARYPCRSGLLISSRDDGPAGTSLVVVRMHHHHTHEAYYDHTLPPEMTQSIWEKIEARSGPSLPISAPPLQDLGPPLENNTSEETEAGDDHDSPPLGERNIVMHEATTAPVSAPQQEDKPTLTEEVFRVRMRQHIANIRDFCDGLEYQLPFNDFRLLEALESQGEQFLGFVNYCLEMEGRLKSSDDQSPMANS
ncbi:hypothetical protein H0H81_012039 [Sphagnurus paluster]|uniref:Uncharacterized protein n=1 Tax=Sphagnurus paluster TaxID=117069 RepID=A0A9P7FWT0_9AGAR|nr:hypothetical protein H0H81_012039 [Sphagnurus paluster]